MDCARCGTPIPAGGKACPNCGLRIRAAPPPMAFKPGGGVWAAVPYRSPLKDGASVTGAADPGQIDKPYAPVGHTTGVYNPDDNPAPAAPAPGEAFTLMNGPAAHDVSDQPDSRLSDSHCPGSDCSLSERQPQYGGVPREGIAKTAGPNMPKPLVIALILCTVSLGVAAALYFLVLKKGSTFASPEATVQAYFAAMSEGDTGSLKTLFTPENKPSENELKTISAMFGNGGWKFEDVELERLSESADRADVRVNDLTLTVAGKSARLSEMEPAEAFVFKLKKVGDGWFIEDARGGLSRQQYNPSPTSGST